MSTANNTDKKEMTFFEHLEELRWHLFRSVIVLFIFTAVAFVFKSFVFDIIILGPKEPWFITNRFFCHLAEVFDKSVLCINSKPLQIININMAGQFTTHIRISFLVGFMAGVPYLMLELWRFIKPALYSNERKVGNLTVLAVNLLFYAGVLLGYYLICPLSIDFLNSYTVSESISNTINLNSYITNLSSICFATGIVFELPVLAYFFSKIGLLSPQFMREYRKHAIIIILIAAAILTPPDIMSMMLVAIPLYLLYEVSIYISASVVKNKKIVND